MFHFVCKQKHAERARSAIIDDRCRVILFASPSKVRVMKNYVVQQKWVSIKVLVLDLRIGRQTLWRWRKHKDFPEPRDAEFWWPAVVDWMIKHHKHGVLRRIGLETRPTRQAKQSRPIHTLTFLDQALLLSGLSRR